MSANLIERIRTAENLPSLPAVAMQILALTRDESVSADSIAAVLQNDPALTARLLKVVNSSMFGIARKVTSVRQAVVLLGLRGVKVLALGFSLTDALNGGAGGGFDYTSFWRRSLTTATAARQLGRCVAASQADEAFVAGLLSEIGTLAAYRCAADVYAPVLKEAQASSQPLCALERQRLGCDHAELGRELLNHWELPVALCEAVGAHHKDELPAVEPQTRKLCALVMAAAGICDAFCGAQGASTLPQAQDQCRRWTGISSSDMEDVLKSLDEHVQETAHMLNVQVGSTLSYAQLQAEASQQMAKLTLEAELDRAASQRQAEDAVRHAERLEREKEAIWELASIDSLTSLANRATLDRRLEEEFHRARRAGSRVGLILLDIDHFKVFNDTHGHLAGDAQLRSLSACVKAAVGATGLVARYGGEEFAVVVPGEPPDVLDRLAEELRRRIENIVLLHEGRELRVTSSFGTACVDGVDLGVGPSLLLRLADEAMYRAKRHGRNRVAGFAPSDHVAAASR
ncbi:MAG: GGDEF domain-containing protein [Phycisphaerales bacterium]|nr:GGDEF domain-containing protein [Phycisphaerales bacterium]